MKIFNAPPSFNKMPESPLPSLLRELKPRRIKASGASTVPTTMAIPPIATIAAPNTAMIFMIDATNCGLASTHPRKVFITLLAEVIIFIIGPRSDSPSALKLLMNPAFVICH